MITGTITHSPTKVSRNTYALSIVAESGTPYLLTVDQLTRDYMDLERGERIQAIGPVYINPTTGISEINPYNLRVLPKSCPSTLYRPTHKRSPRPKGPRHKQCPQPQAAFAI